ncbi:MAG: GAF domain-containing protein [Cyanobacteria bacterium P01_A01_bin.83]
MNHFDLPSPLDKIFADTDDLPIFFDRLMLALVELLACDRCYLYLRDPQHCIGQILHCYSIHPELPNLIEAEKRTEDFYISKANPLFAAAINCEATIFIEDIDNVSPIDQDQDFWQQNYCNHKSLIQAHLCLNQELWGILQISNFNRPRPWTKFDRSLVSQIVNRITPLASIYAQKKLGKTVQQYHDGKC